MNEKAQEAARSMNLAFPALTFLVLFFLGPYWQLAGFERIAGDIGDGRLNNYFLENIYQYFAGHSSSLWHLGFFWPFPYVGGFSDNLFGSAPVYLLARTITGESDTAFQVWFYFGYLANFAACYVALRKLRLDHVGASIGAAIFAFALPVATHAGHAQLHYRFGIPLSVASFLLFLEQKDWRKLVTCFAWIVWQFYCGVYMGFFAMLMIGAITFVFFLRLKLHAHPVSSAVNGFGQSWKDLKVTDRYLLISLAAVLILLLILLFYPYLQVSALYGAKRGWGEISSMLPRPQSYILSDRSSLWSSPDLPIFSGIPMRHEHQMFVGAVPLVLGLMGAVMFFRRGFTETAVMMAGSIIVLVIATLNIRGYSIWFLFHYLPLFSAIRAVTRIDQVLLFPVAFLAGFAVQSLQSSPHLYRMPALAVLALLVGEIRSQDVYSSERSEWRNRILAVTESVPTDGLEGKVLFLAQRNGPSYADELDAMWIALERSIPTLNGYSGLMPPDHSLEFKEVCAELEKRVRSYRAFSGRVGAVKDGHSMRQILVIGNSTCPSEWLQQQ